MRELNREIPAVGVHRARRQLKPILGHLVDAVHAAFDSGKHARLVRNHLRARATLMTAHFEDEVRQRLGHTGAAFIDRSNRFTVGFGNLLVRLKKVSADYRTRNYPTETSKMYDRQLHLPELPDVPRLTLGYRVSSMGDRLLEIVLIYARGSQVVWVSALEGAATVVEQLPLRQTQPARTRRVRVRPNAKAPSKKTEEG